MGFTINDYDHSNSFITERKLLLFAGFYPQLKQKYVYKFSFVAILVLSCGLLLTMIIQMAIDRNNIEKLTESLLYFFTQLSFLFKLFNFIAYRKQLLGIEIFLKDPIFYGHSFDQLNIIKRKIRFCDLFGTAYRMACAVTITFFAFVPYIDDSREGTLPVPGWFPYNTNKHFFVTIFLQEICVFIGAYCNTSIDILTWKLLSLSSAHFEILKENLSNIDYTMEFSTIREHLVHCINHHFKTNKLTQLTQNLFSVGIFFQLFGSIMVICTTGFQTIMVSVPSVRFFVLLMYLSAMLYQIATYCWYGHDVTTTSDMIGTAFYMSSWYESDIKIRKTVFVFLERLKQPILVKAGNFVTLSLITFTQILRSSYSYFAVLQRLYNDV